ncbi:hypothetical protein M404DRAFT_1009183 [Pisolithus tinctorius Marx 270]|uniref:Uncharacterized protein n=1 Tax=Pisolithus tinctorius Marx 270 TaxID=870435 RepID=A0A0C3I7I4_PISTI|nr:hypothetical protein M404DRAFT_1009183 [Pisolithus tinctorius Marx 270]
MCVFHIRTSRRSRDEKFRRDKWIEPPTSAKSFVSEIRFQPSGLCEFQKSTI